MYNRILVNRICEPLYSILRINQAQFSKCSSSGWSSFRRILRDNWCSTRWYISSCCFYSSNRLCHQKCRIKRYERARWTWFHNQSTTNTRRHIKRLDKMSNTVIHQKVKQYNVDNYAILGIASVENQMNLSTCTLCKLQQMVMEIENADNYVWNMLITLHDWSTMTNHQLSTRLERLLRTGIAGTILLSSASSPLMITTVSVLNRHLCESSKANWKLLPS